MAYKSNIKWFQGSPKDISKYSGEKLLIAYSFSYTSGFNIFAEFIHLVKSSNLCLLSNLHETLNETKCW